MTIEIQGVLTDIVFYNEANGYIVGVVDTGEEDITVVGYMPIVNKGETFAFNGKWTVHPVYGKQLEILSYRQVAPNTLEGMENYLASGLIKGIGPKTAKKIVDKFGKDALDIIQYRPHLLTQIEGIGGAKANLIAEAFQEQRELQEVMLFLQQYGVTPSYGIKIYKKYGQDTIRLIQENPYRLADEIIGIGFRIADTIAKRMGIDPRSSYRLMCGLKYMLMQGNLEGHTYTPREELLRDTARLLEVEVSLLEEPLMNLALNNEVQLENLEGEIVVFGLSYFFAETYVCKKLIELAKTEIPPMGENLGELIKKIEENEGLELADNQKHAIKEALQNGVTVITGGPGTGKTTTINSIIRIFEMNNLSILLGAPTGRAAKRMSEATGREAKTIHRLLEYAYAEDDLGMAFGRNEEEPLAADVVIIDEMSMVDILLMKALLRAILPGTRLILVGDVDQLPSVGPGNVLRDIIESNIFRVVKLDKIFRQAQESMIIVNAHRINKGQYPYTNQKEKDFYFISKKTQENIAETIKALCKERLPKYNGFDPIKDIQVLTPMKKGVVGMLQLNNQLQSILNPKAPHKEEKEMKEKIFRVGDKVMQIKNNYNLKWKKTEDDGDGEGIFNGDMGYIQEIDTENRELWVLFDDEKLVKYDFSQLDELELAYCITIHKSQGSEFPVVVMPVSWGPPMLQTRNLLYTAVTRAKKLVVMVGQEGSLKNMVDNHRITKRNTGLGVRLRRFLEDRLIEF
ncbi:ATP-dependent DNA helicase, RecD/TraA family [Geosporobacter subterraneus DSM 17957]|uniref:ATP-dependent RecD2 DNA helicase n=1 Tax=Geosporobacter subterraneus DSM 17957 TaxID=1121919 RepID=A0A1M6CL71_9FIRM|nr:ATP-dependent RecD-like DNA helicase [Geosporobacter subterraneus]SHI61730.1 ATP-dependent DNA helicase, RecD/TraA family [Geosporobacter subterraneus DSM 17957]